MPRLIWRLRAGLILLIMLENGVRIMVPPFVEAGDKIVVDTSEVTYIKRAD